MHDKFGHFSIGKTYSLIRRYYFWPKMIKHIQRHVQSCSLCSREEIVADKYKLRTIEIPHRPFAKVSVDLIVDLPVCHKRQQKYSGNGGPFVWIPIAEAIPNKEAATVADAIYNKLILEHTCLKICCLTMARSSQMIHLHMSVTHSI